MKNILIIVGLLIVILITIFLTLQSDKKPEVVIMPENIEGKMVTIKGEYKGGKQKGKGSMGIVNGILLADTGLEEGKRYSGKIVEVNGKVKKYPCPENGEVQCFNGLTMINIQSIKIIDE